MRSGPSRHGGREAMVARWSRAAVVAAAAVGIAAVACAGNDPARPRAEKAITYTDRRQLDLYRPVRGIGPLPAVVLVHGGGFVDGSRQDLAAVAEAFARRGYVAVTIDYQLSVGNWFPATTLDQ